MSNAQFFLNKYPWKFVGDTVMICL